MIDVLFDAALVMGEASDITVPVVEGSRYNQMAIITIAATSANIEPTTVPVDSSLLPVLLIITFPLC